ncbi:MAG: SelB C-terminal domain-containing protein, partial [Candidatus Cloacimonetes bacterium]|nr:SelB C-terminal domain-containing protein [Candidatus Cloacimonadota bacterium]
EVIFRQLPPELKFIQGKNQLILMEKKTKTVLENKILSKLAEFHRKNPLIPTGQNFNELMGIFGTEQKDNTRQILQLLLANLVEENKLRENDNKNWSLANHEVSIDKSIMDKIGFIADVITDVDKGFIGINDLELAAAHKQILQQEFQQIIQYLLDQKKIVLLKKHAVASKYLQTVRDKLINYLRTEPSGITVSGYRDLIDSNRACSLLLLEYFDESGITVRKDNIRVLSNRFRQQ